MQEEDEWRRMKTNEDEWKDDADDDDRRVFVIVDEFGRYNQWMNLIVSIVSMGWLIDRFWGYISQQNDGHLLNLVVC